MGRGSKYSSWSESGPLSLLRPHRKESLLKRLNVELILMSVFWRAATSSITIFTLPTVMLVHISVFKGVDSMFMQSKKKKKVKAVQDKMFLCISGTCTWVVPAYPWKKRERLETFAYFLCLLINSILTWWAADGREGFMIWYGPHNFMTTNLCISLCVRKSEGYLNTIIRRGIWILEIDYTLERVNSSFSLKGNNYST